MVPFLKRNPLLFLIIFLIFFIPLVLYLYKFNLGTKQKNTQTQGNVPSSTNTIPEEVKISCEELAKIRTNNRKTGAVVFENKDKSTSSAQMFRVGEKYIRTYSDIPSPDTYTRAGKVLEVNESGQIVTLDVGEGRKMKVKPLKMRVMKNSIKFGQKVDDTYTTVAGFCGLEKGDIVEFSLNKKDSKNYKDVIISDLLKLVQ